MKLLLKLNLVFCFCLVLFNCCTKEVEKIVEVPVYKTPTDSSGCTNNDSITICYTKTSPCTLGGEEFTFTASGKATEKDVEKYEWYFGDGDSSITTQKTVTKTYTGLGYKNVLLKVKKYRSYLEKRINVWADGQNAMPEPYIATIHSVNIIGSTATYRFQANVYHSYGSYTYAWNFGDGKMGDEQFMNHTYDLKSTEQKLKIYLTVTSKAGCQAKDSQTITIPPYYNITDSIKYSVTGVCDNNEEFVFSGPLNNVPANAQYIWNFGDGIPDNGNYCRKKFTYQKGYPVALSIVYNNREIYKKSITVESKGQFAKPLAAFDIVDGYTNSTDKQFHFNNPYNPTDGYYYDKIYWDFGDGNFDSTGSKRNPSNIYKRQNQDKIYQVKMTVISSSGCSNFKTVSVFIPKL